MSDRVLDVKRVFGHVLDLGAGAGHLERFVTQERCAAARKERAPESPRPHALLGSVKHFVMMDSCEAMLRRDAAPKLAGDVVRWECLVV